MLVESAVQTTEKKLLMEIEGLRKKVLASEAEAVRLRVRGLALCVRRGDEVGDRERRRRQRGDSKRREMNMRMRSCG